MDELGVAAMVVQLRESVIKQGEKGIWLGFIVILISTHLDFKLFEQ